MHASNPAKLPLSAAARRLMLAAALAAALPLAGCIVVPARGHYAPSPVVAVPPPAPQVEVVGVAPYPGAFWIGGYWGWNGHRHHWYPGRWEAPRRGHTYVPHSWQPEGKGWRERPGRWAPVH